MGLLPKHLRRHILKRAHRCFDCAFSRFKHLCAPEIGQTYSRFAVYCLHENILELNVTVHNVLLVKLCDDCDKLPHYVLCLVLSEGVLHPFPFQEAI